MKPLWISFWLVPLLSLTIQATEPLNVLMSGNTISGSIKSVSVELANPGTEAAITNVFSLQGDRVAELTAQSLNHFTWDGTDVDQEPVPSGLYVIQVSHGGSVWHGPVFVNR